LFYPVVLQFNPALLHHLNQPLTLQGNNGDGLWPTINRAQHFVENSYPELVIEMIYDMLKTSENNTAL